MKNTQKNRVIQKLLRDGYITRNECLKQVPAITRLSAIIQILEEEGWVFSAKDVKTGTPGGDYMYTPTTCPLKKQVYTLPNGEVITSYK